MHRYSTVVPNAEAILNASDALGSVSVFLMLETVVSETPIFFCNPAVGCVLRPPQGFNIVPKCHSSIISGILLLESVVICLLTTNISS